MIFAGVAKVPRVTLSWNHSESSCEKGLSPLLLNVRHPYRPAVRVTLLFPDTAALLGHAP